MIAPAIMEIARKKKWNKMIATVRPDNVKMLKLFKKKGCNICFDSDEGINNIVYDLTKN